MIDASAIDAIAALTRHGEKVEVLQPGQIYLRSRADGGYQTVDLTDHRLAPPPAKAGSTTVTDRDSFLQYFDKHSDEHSEIFANLAHSRIDGILDAHTGIEPRRQQHTVTLLLAKSPQLQAWLGINNHLVDQESFAEFIAEQRATIREPNAAEVLELVQNFQQTTKAEFRSGVQLANGQRQLIYTENSTTSGGTGGKLSIPTELQLALPIYRGATQAEQITARLQTRIVDSSLQLRVRLTELDQAVEVAFDEVVTAIRANVDGSVLVLRS